jgi:hypothetical protein
MIKLQEHSRNPWTVQRDFDTYIGIDLGGARGKTTAVARIERDPEDARGALVTEVSTRGPDGNQPWADDVLLSYLRELRSSARVAVAIDAPLTLPACVRCQLTACPGEQRCEVPAVVWLRTQAERLEASALGDLDRIAAVPASPAAVSGPTYQDRQGRVRLPPYTHRCTEVELVHGRGVLSPDHLGRAIGPVAARASHLRRALGGLGFQLNGDLIEVSPRGTVQTLFGRRVARGYKRDADPWQTRATILESLSHNLRFAAQSRLAREEVLRNDHCFEALLSGYTLFLWARDGWQLPAEVFADDGWIWLPPAP